jgi:hypothetical protein
MPPKHRQLRAPRPKASGNAFQALVDPPHDGNNLSFDGGDERGFAALSYVSPEIFREFYVDFGDIRRESRVFTRFR